MIFYKMWYDDKIPVVKYSKVTDWDHIQCSNDAGHNRAGGRIGILTLDIVRKTTANIMWTFLSECIISEKVKILLSEHKITGCNLKPIKIAKGQLPSSYWEFIVIGKGGEADKRSGIYLKEYCKHCNFKRYSAYENGIIIDKNNWDGSDIFNIVGYEFIIVTEKIKYLFELNHVSGIIFTPSHELKWPEGVIKP